MLARRGVRTVHPNPPVGAVIVREGRVLGRGWHMQAGGAHAEIKAIDHAGSSAQGATLYVTLEPCNHTGRTGPCADAVIAAGITRVVAGIADANPKVKGGGAEKLRDAGIEVVVGCMERDVRELKESWLKWIRTGRPLVVGLLFRSVDGRLAECRDPILASWRGRVRDRFQHLGIEVDLDSLGAIGIQNVLIEDAAGIVTLVEKRKLDRLLVVQTTEAGGAELFPKISEATARAMSILLDRVRRLGPAVVAEYSFPGES